ncbi:MAG: enoyl-CoA hydratase/isomerase family protein [Chloroflexi bacterium]|nr:enoyl-CoA hydratase/isomerase family protein [Chloroflexota bacterium]
MSGLVVTERVGPIAVITLNRPQRHNSLIPELVRDLLDALAELNEPSAVRALILQANGRSFSTGGDVQGFVDHQADVAAYAGELVGLLNQAILRLTAFPAPILAAVHGVVTGGSLGLVLACDIILVAPEVTFTPFYTAVGFSPDGGWTAMLPALIGVKRAANALLFNAPITAQQAVDWGVAQEIVVREQIHARARSLAEQLARQPTGSVQRARRLVWGDGAGLAERLEAERRQFIQ